MTMKIQTLIIRMLKFKIKDYKNNIKLQNNNYQKEVKSKKNNSKLIYKTFKKSLKNYKEKSKNFGQSKNNMKL